MLAHLMRFVCPACKGSLAFTSNLYSCSTCRRDFPVVAGIPDFRLTPDPYIGIQEDRDKGLRLLDASTTRGFEALVRYYYAITPDHPPDLAERRVRHALAEVALARFALEDARLGGTTPPGPLLDIGCSTGALLNGAAGRFAPLVGVDVAFRWLVVGAVRLREAGVDATLVCANAEALPFPDGTFAAVTATDTIEHVSDVAASASECHRVLAPDGVTYWSTNNRYAPLPEPHIGVWGVGYRPRARQREFVARRRTDLRPYLVQLRSASELDRVFRVAGFRHTAVTAAPLFAPHYDHPVLSRALRLYNVMRRLPVARSVARVIGPRLSVRARR